ncbi:MAG: LysM peptidoglycan-binding domain-containing protein [Clostridium lundense]|nr:LysM peptidoglycan-binding domain-containing protein [Clostridium lundense]
MKKLPSMSMALSMVFTMLPVSAMAEEAHTTIDANGGGGSGETSSDNSSSAVIVTPPAPDKPNSPTQGEIKFSGTVDSKGNVTVNITDKTVTNAFDKALVDGNGKVHWLVNSVYDSVEKVLRFSTDHFSIYPVGYKQDAPALTDISTNWAKNDIEFVVSRGLFSGTMQGWTMNDSGKWMYYENGTYVTGKKEIDGLIHTFDQYGVKADAPKNLKYTPYTTLWLIARKLGCTMSELERMNNKSRFDMIHPGDVLRVPEK